MENKIDLINHLMGCWERRDVDAVLDCLTEDIEYYWHIGTKPVKDKSTMRKFLNNYSGRYDQKRWEIFNFAENENLLLGEGHEELWDRSNHRTIHQPFMQAFEFRDGLVSHWRDYYEPENLTLTSKSEGLNRAFSRGSAREVIIDTPNFMETMLELIDASITQDKEKFISLCDPDIEYILHTSARPLSVTDLVARFLDKYFAEMTDLDWRIDRWAQNGNKLLVEGCEEYRERASGRFVSHPYMGIVEFSASGKIMAMRDYFEMNSQVSNE